MKNFICAWLVLMLSWNAVLGVFGNERLCLHEDLSAHVDDHDTCQGETEESEFGHAEADHCPPCVDVELRSIELKKERPSNPVLPLVYAVLATEEFGSPPTVELQQRTRTPLLRGPPKVRPDGELIAQTIVLRL